MTRLLELAQDQSRDFTKCWSHGAMLEFALSISGIGLYCSEILINIVLPLGQPLDSNAY